MRKTFSYALISTDPINSCLHIFTGKGNAFEGGTRVLAAVSGGLLPSSQFGRKLPAPGLGHVAMADFYETFCGLSGHTDCSDSPLGVPPSESYDMWPLFSGTTDRSPRIETVLEYRGSQNTTLDDLDDAAIVQGDWKYIQGRQASATTQPCLLSFAWQDLRQAHCTFH